MKKYNSKFQNGFTLIEGIIGIAIFLVIFLALVSLFSVVFSMIRNNKAMMTANVIALEQLEVIRGMDFNDVKTDTGWSPAGPILSQRTLNRSGISFTVQVDIVFIDDPYDGTDGAGDTFPYDYKKARTRVLWTNPVNGGTEIVAMSTNIVPFGLEGLSDGKGGILAIVFDASGQPVFEAVVDITNTAKSYSSLGNLTDLNGNLWIPDLDPSAVSPEGDYHIVVTKAGYNSDQTYAVDTNFASPTYNPNPTKPDSVVVEREVTKIGFAIDLVGNINVKTTSYENPENLRVNTDDLASGNDQTEIAVDIDSDDNIILGWLDTRDGGTERLYTQKYKYSDALGEFEKQWPTDVPVTTSNNKKTPRIAVFDTNYFYMTGTDDRNGNRDVFLEKRSSLDGSEIWGNIKVNIEAGNYDQIHSDLAVDSDENIYIVWMDDRNGNWDIYVQKYDPNGNSLWPLADLKINNDIGASDRLNPRIIVDNDAPNNFYVIWEDKRNGNKDIYWKKFDSNKNVLINDSKINTDISVFDQYEPSIDFDDINGYFYISWSDRRNSQPDIYAQKYDKNGNVATVGNWAIGDVKINDDSKSDAWRTKSSVAYSSIDNVLYYSWQDDRNGSQDVYSAKIDANGNKLWIYDLIMNSNATETQGSPNVVADSTGYGITVWEDERSGDFDVYAARYKELGSLVGKSVPIIVHGVKLKGTYPTDNPIYKFTDTPTSDGKLFTTDASGNVTISDIEWDNYEFITGTGYTIISTDQPVPLVINPEETKDIVINVEP